MKLLLITPSYKPAYIYGGPTMSVAKLCEALIANADTVPALHLEVEVLATTANGKEELTVEPGKQVDVDGVPVTYFKRLTKDHTHFSPALLRALRKEIKAARAANKPLLIHIHSWWNLVSIFSCWLARYYRVPVSLTPRGMLTAYTSNNRNGIFKKLIHQWIGKRLLPYCHIHATSEKEKQDILTIIKPKSITVIPNLVDLPPEQSEKTERAVKTEEEAKIIEEAATSERPFQLIFLSRIEEKKGLDILFQALSKLTFPWQLTLGGNGESAYIAQLKNLTTTLGIKGKINWIGHVANNDKFNLLRQHDLFVLSSHNENFANVVIESLSVGTPVLLSDQVGLADYVLKKDLGYVCSLEPPEITRALEKGFSEQSLRATIRQEAPVIIRRDFGDEYLTSRYIQLYQQIN